MAGNTRQNRLRTTLRKTHNAASTFSALGDNLRLLLLNRLAGSGPLSITRLTAGTDVTRQAVTKHLRVLAAAGLVRCSRHGREQLWQLDGEALRQAREQLDMVARQWDRALQRLKDHLGEE